MTHLLNIYNNYVTMYSLQFYNILKHALIYMHFIINSTNNVCLCNDPAFVLTYSNFTFLISLNEKKWENLIFKSRGNDTARSVNSL